MDVHALRNIDDQLDIGVVVVVSATWDLDVVVSHADVVCIGLQILGRGHNSEMDSPLVTKDLICPFSHGADFLDGGNTVVRNQDL
jgi:hypothetical protein